MKLNDKCLANKAFLKQNDIQIPLFNREIIKYNTHKNPKWLHFGPGNIFRAFIAAAQQTLLNNGYTDTGIIAVAPNNNEIIDKVYKPHDNLSLLVTMNADNSLEKKIIGSVTESLTCNPQSSVDWQRLINICCNPELQIISFTITEKGYKLHNEDNSYLSTVKEDLRLGPDKVKSFMAKVVSLLYHRYLNGAHPITLVSMDNCSHNGEVLSKAIITLAIEWEKTSLVQPGFSKYLKTKISYPCTMIDKITPRPSEKIQQYLSEIGFSDMNLISSNRGGQYAPFVNAEKTEYLVIEDIFLNGRPPLEKAGIIFTDKTTVDKVERMKVCTCLNPLHTTLAVYGCLLGYTLIADEMKNPLLKKLVEKIGYDEGMKVVTNPGVLSPQKFIAECLNERFPNPAIPDTPQRIACDTSQKIGIRFGETIKAYMQSKDLQSENLVYIPLAIAGWCRYLLGIDDKGVNFEISPDPLLSQLKNKLGKIFLGENINVHKRLMNILNDKNIFGVNLYDAGIGKKIETYFAEMITSTNAVENTLKKYLKI